MLIQTQTGPSFYLPCEKSTPNMRGIRRSILLLTTLMALAISAKAQWQIQTGVPELDLYSIEPYSASVVNGGALLGLLRTTDSGASWDTTYITVFGAPFPGALYDIHFFSSQVGVATGLLSLGSQHVMLRTTNAGTSWTVAYYDQIGGGILAVHDLDFINAANGIAVGTDNTLLRTSDAGLTWTRAANSSIPGSGHLYGVQYSDANICHVVGGNRILRSVNGGANWLGQTFTGMDLRAVHFPTADVGYAVGQHEAILKTIDTGQTWNQLPGIPGAGANDVFFTSATEGYATAGTRIYHTTTGGSYWEWFECGAQMNGVSFLDGLGYAVGVSGTLLRTTASGLGYRPLSWFNVEGTVFCQDSTIQLTSRSSPALQHTWYLNGDVFSTDISPSLVISEAQQTDTITLVVSNGTQTDSHSQTVTIAPSLSVPLNYELATDTVCHGAATTVMLQTTVSGVSYRLMRDGQTVGSPQISNGGALTFPTNPLTTTATWTIQAVRTVSGCGTGTTTTSFEIAVRPTLQLATVVPLEEIVCVAELVPIVVQNTQLDVAYGLRIGTENVGTTQQGNGGTITFMAGSTDTTTTYNVFATNAYGCAASLTQTATIHLERPEAHFTVPSYNPLVGTTWPLINTTNITGASYEWSFGPSATPVGSSSILPDVTFAQPGQATIILSVTTPQGCVDEYEVVLQIIDPFTPGSCIGIQGYQLEGSGNFLCGMAFGPKKELVTLIHTKSSQNVKFFGSHQDSVMNFPSLSGDSYSYYNHLLKVDSTGVPQWMLSIDMEDTWGGQGEVVVDPNGNIFALINVGSSSPSLDSVRVHSTDGRFVGRRATSSTSGESKAILACWDPNGVLRWCQIVPAALQFALGGDGKLRLLNSPFLRCYDSENGIIEWEAALHYSGSFYRGNDIVTDPVGTSYVAGRDGIDIYATDGVYMNSIVVAQNIPIVGINPNIYIQGISIDTDNSLYVTGPFNGHWSFGADTIVNPSPSAYHDFFVSRIAPDGEISWSRQIKVVSVHPRFYDGFTVCDGHVLWLAQKGEATVSVEGYPSYTTDESGDQFLVHFSTDGGTPRVLEYPMHAGEHNTSGTPWRNQGLVTSMDGRQIACASRFGNTIEVNGATYVPYTSPNIVSDYLLTMGAVDCYINNLPSPTATPISYFLSPDASTCPWQLITFQDASLNAATEWLWELPGATPAESSEQNPEVMYMGPGTYEVTLTTLNSNGTGTTYTSSVVIDVCTGLAEHLGQAFSVGPIPAENSMFVRTELNGMINYTVLDMQGRVLSTGRFERIGTIDTSSLSSGTYALELVSRDQRTATRFTVQH